MTDTPQPTWDELGDEQKPITTEATICTRQDLITEIGRLKRQLEQTIVEDRLHNREPQAPQIARRIADLEDEAREHEVTYVFRSIGREGWSDLLREHPPKPEDRRAGSDHNRITFPPAAIVATCVSPEGATIDNVTPMWNERWSTGQCQRIWAAVLAANVGAGDVPSSDAVSALLRDSGRRWTTAAPEGSPAHSS